MRGQVFLQYNGPFERLIAVSAREQFIAVYILFMRRHSLLGCEFSITNFAVESIVWAFVPQHMMLEGVLVLVFATTHLTF